MSAHIPRNVKYCFIAIVKEGMSNIIKHSNADKVDIIFREHPGFTSSALRITEVSVTAWKSQTTGSESLI